MKGSIRKLVPVKGYGFITASNGADYFFHKDDFSGHFEDLVEDYQHGVAPSVSFEIAESPKGPRAKDVRRTDHPNEAA